MKYYKNDIVELMNNCDEDCIGRRYLVTGYGDVFWQDGTLRDRHMVSILVYNDIHKTEDEIEVHRTSVRLVHRPFLNHVKSFFNFK